MKRTAAIILAAGKSTRMKSDLPKVLHPLGGRRLIDYVLEAVSAACVDDVVVVVGHKAEEVKAALSDYGGLRFALQSEQLGTGHAVMVCEPLLSEHDGPVLVLAGDMPLVRPGSLERLLREQEQSGAACVIGTAVTPNNAGLGRIVRDEAGRFVRIVEEKDATEQEKQIQEINTGCYAFDCRLMFEALRHVRPNNRQAEYYLTDCPSILKQWGHRVVACPAFDSEEAMGVNTQEQLAAVERVLHQRTLA